MRFVQLDILRTVAVLMVLASHIPPAPKELGGIVVAIIEFWQTYGHLGVDLFFVLSGFLVSGLLFREHQTRGSMRVGRFLVRRGFKIYPAFYVFLIATVTLRLAYGDSISVAQVVCESLFVQNYGPHVWSHTWSLAVEEHFYLLLAGMFFLLARNGRLVPFRRLPMVFAATVLAVIVSRALTIYFLPFANKTHLFATHLRLEELFCGVFMAYLYHVMPGTLRSVAGARVTLVLLALSLLILRFACLGATWGYVLGPTIVAISFSLVVVVAMNVRCPDGGAVGAIASCVGYLGQHSYSIYLWHTAVLVFGTILLRKVLGTQPSHLLASVLYLCVAFMFGIVMAKAVEIPALRLRDRLFPSANGGNAVSAIRQESLVVAGVAT